MYIGDLHIHSHYSRATSKDCTLESLDIHARRKGIQLLGTGDFTHPAWRKEMSEKLICKEEGIYILKEDPTKGKMLPWDQGQTHFVISGEISSIYKKDGKVRKVHSLILLPSIEDGEVLSKKLETVGNLHSDGRPILGLSCHDLLEITLDVCPKAIYVPAHIWTPHFSLFGAFSGFDTVEECFGDLAPYIHAMETGLSSDPPMNWRISSLDRYQLISNSDAHSPSKLGREANLFDTEMSYTGLYDAIQYGKGLEGTIEFFPEEGKYHYDGHRKCHLCLSPVQTQGYKGICPVCGKKLTIGVSHRVEQLADREEGFVKERSRPFESLIPLQEIITASIGLSPSSKKGVAQYEEMLEKLGTEFDILRKVPLEDIRKGFGNLLSEGIRRLRMGEVKRSAGFDGEYGSIELFEPWERSQLEGQLDFFAGLGISIQEEKQKMSETIGREHKHKEEKGKNKELEERSMPIQLNERQKEAATIVSRTISIIAGPGTGKTKTLVSRILHLLKERKVPSTEITALTFTNQAAKELEERLKNDLGKKGRISRMQIGTFHSICLQFLQDQGMEFSIVEEWEALEIAEKVLEEVGIKRKASSFLKDVSRRKAGEKEGKELPEEAFQAYHRVLMERKLLDFDDLLLTTLSLLQEDKQGKIKRKQFSYLLVDEFQDINQVQYKLIKMWNQGGKELFVIGDPDQAIYGFRGSHGACFEKLQEDFTNLIRISLVDNYRSTPQILSAALPLISNNKGIERRMEAVRKEGPLLRLVETKSFQSEASFVAREISRLIGGLDMLDAQDKGGEREASLLPSFSDIGILYRTHRQGDVLEKALKKEGIPYIVTGRDDFLTERNVRGSLCFFQYLLSPEKIFLFQSAKKLLWDSDERNLSIEEAVEKYKLLIGKKKLSFFLENWIKDMEMEDEGMKKFVSMAPFHKKLEDFLNSLSRGTEGELKRWGGKGYTWDAVNLMTFHGAKGLEFRAVILIGVNEGIIPLIHQRGEENLEEERRLFYVGLTRAKEELVLVTSKEPSRFLKEIPKEYMEKKEGGGDRRWIEGRQMSLFDK